MKAEFKELDLMLDDAWDKAEGLLSHKDGVNDPEARAVARVMRAIEKANRAIYRLQSPTKEQKAQEARPMTNSQFVRLIGY